jgi:hypothetical protein
MCASASGDQPVCLSLPSRRNPAKEERETKTPRRTCAPTVSLIRCSLFPASAFLICVMRSTYNPHVFRALDAFVEEPVVHVRSVDVGEESVEASSAARRSRRLLLVVRVDALEVGDDLACLLERQPRHEFVASPIARAREPARPAVRDLCAVVAVVAVEVPCSFR